MVAMPLVMLSSGLAVVPHRQALNLTDQRANEQHQHGQHRQQADPALPEGAGAQETSG